MSGDSLKHFVLRSHALKLFRDFARTAKRLPSKQEYNDVMSLVRQEFDKHRSEKDTDTIEDCIMYGNVQLRTLKDSVHNMCGGLGK